MAPDRAVTRLSSNTEMRTTADKNTYEYYLEKAKTEKKKRVAAKAAKAKKDKKDKEDKGSTLTCIFYL